MSPWTHAVLSTAALVTAEGLVLFLLRLTLLAALGHLALALIPRASAATRHLVATLTLAALVALPIAIVSLPAWRLPIFPRRVAVEPPSPALQLTTADTFVKRTYDAFDGDTPFGAVRPIERMTTSRPIPLAARLPGLPRVPKSWPLAVAILVLAVSEAMLLRLAVSLVAASWFARGAVDVGDPRVLGVFRAAGERLGLRRSVSLRMTPRVSVPVVSGLVRPTLVLPSGACGWDDERLNVVFLHELAHVQRCDSVCLLLARTAGALYWFHPFVRSLVRAARRECEQACDDRVLESGIRASAYADHLLTIARGAVGRDTLGGAVLAIARRSNLERRLSSILRLGVERRPASRRATALAALASLVLLLPLATVRVTAASAPRAAKHHSDAHDWNALEPVALPAPVATATPPAPVAATPAVPPTSGPTFAYGGENDNENNGDSDASGNLQFKDHFNRNRNRSDEESGRQWYSRARRYYNRDRFGEAGEAYERAARAGYNIETALYNAACSYALDHQRDKSLTMLASAVDAGWDDVHMLESDSDLESIRGDRRFRQIVDQARSADPDESDKKSADAEFEALRSSRSSDPDAWGEAGVSLMHSGDPSRAVQAFQTQIRLEPSADAMYNLACAQALSGAKAEALSSLERAILEGYGNAEHMREDDDLAPLRSERRFQELVRMTEDLRLNGDGLGDRDRQGWRESVPRFERMTRQYPSAGRTWFNLGYAQLKARDLEGSKSSFTHALDLEYRTPTTMYNLACVSAQLHDFDGAMEWLERAQSAGMSLENYAPGDRDLDPLRADPRFRTMLDRLGDRKWDKLRTKLKNL